MSARQSAAAHARNSWECPCGKVVRGNGGISSHRSSCLAWAKHRLDGIERALARIEAGDFGQKLSPGTIRGFRHQWAIERDRLRAKLGLEPVTKPEEEGASEIQPDSATQA